MKCVYPAGASHHLVSQFHTMGTVTGSATQAGTKLATAAFKAAPSGLRWTSMQPQVQRQHQQSQGLWLHLEV